MVICSHSVAAGRLSGVMQMAEKKSKNSVRYIAVEMWRSSYKGERFLEMELSDKFLCFCRALLVYIGDLYLLTWVSFQDWDAKILSWKLIVS